MKLNYFTKLLPTAGRWFATALLFVSAIAGHGAFFSTPSAMAAPTLIAADAGNQVKDKTREDAGRAKDFIRDTADKVEQTANKNADRVEKATSGKGSFVELKAKRDAARIRRRAEEDASRTQKAVDKTKNAVE
ncbi:MAG: hypothetical protein LH702_18420, partial [Phormidesmis sp. CAN_BIN44]|nr:hypothetical protein [Phormidesmis sp. CAN_BIN44]